MSVRAILDRCLEGRELTAVDAHVLHEAADAETLASVADELRRQQVGDLVTYVVNRNINFTNVCIKSCGFCAFSRKHRSEAAYFLSTDEVVRRVLEARAMGATEVCLQAGLAPGLDGNHYVDLCRAVKTAAPDVHIHAFSPEEVKYGAKLSGRTLRDYLSALSDAGLGSLPGTSAEILDEAIREEIAPGRITVSEWMEVITTAHDLGIPTTSTIMFGHIESAMDRLKHLDLLRTLQKRTGGFTEIVPLSFVYDEAPLYRLGLSRGVRAGPTPDEVTRLFALTRLMLGATFRNVQVSWVKLGFERSRELLAAGANDLGGTLMNESISTTAGARHGQLATPAALRALARAARRVPAERTTRYEVLRKFSLDGAGDPESPLDLVSDADRTFGSYRALAGGGEHRYRFVHSRAKAS